MYESWPSTTRLPGSDEEPKSEPIPLGSDWARSATKPLFTPLPIRNRRRGRGKAKSIATTGLTWLGYVFFAAMFIGLVATAMEYDSDSPGLTSTRDITESPCWKAAVSHCSNSGESAALGITSNECIAMYITLAEN